MVVLLEGGVESLDNQESTQPFKARLCATPLVRSFPLAASIYREIVFKNAWKESAGCIDASVGSAHLRIKPPHTASSVTRRLCCRGTGP